MKKKLSLNKETIIKLNNSEMSKIDSGIALTISCTCQVVLKTIEILTEVTRGSGCDMWSFGEPDCPFTPLRDKGRGDD
jgi:hypothetical protein